MDNEANSHRATESDIAVHEELAAERLRTLAAERLQTLVHLEALHDDFDSLVEAITSSNSDDEHDPEGATLAFERAQVVALLAQFRSRLDDIDRAVELCEQGNYGICERCLEAIPAERLAARPAARTCIRCAF